MIRISIIIPTHNRPAELLRLLLSLQERFHATVQEVIVVANLPNDPAERIVMDFESVLPIKYFVSGKKGVNCARNLGVEMSTIETDYFLFLDDDCVVDSAYFFQSIIKNLSEEVVDVLGGYYTTLNPTNLGYVYFLKKKSWLEYYNEGSRANRVLGGLMIIKRTVFRNVKFNEKIVFGGSETDLVIQLLDRGFYIKIDEQLAIGHSYDLKFSDVIRKFFLQGLHHYGLPQKHQYIPKKDYNEIYQKNLKNLQVSYVRKLVINALTITHAVTFKAAKIYVRLNLSSSQSDSLNP